MGRPESQTRKRRKRTALKQPLIAVRLVEESTDTSTGVSRVSYHEAAKKVAQDHYARTFEEIKINHNTIRNHHLALHQPHSLAIFSNTLLSKSQESELVYHAQELGRRGFPMDHESIRELANLIVQSEDPDFPGVGINWPARFIERHWDALQMYWSTPLESVRGNAVNQNNMDHFFNILEELYQKYGFKAENTYGADESGLMTGIGQKQKVVGSRGKKTQHQKREVNRENTTVIATICADGSSLPPTVIFKGKHYQVRWAQNNPLKAS